MTPTQPYVVGTYPLRDPERGAPMNPLRAWNPFWFAPISARPLGAFRIVFGLVALANLALLSVDLDYWFTDAGCSRGPRPARSPGRCGSRSLQWVQDPASVRVFFAATAVVGVSCSRSAGRRG